MQARHCVTPPGPPPERIPWRSVTGILASDWSEHWRQHTMFISRQPIRGQAESARQKTVSAYPNRRRFPLKPQFLTALFDIFIWFFKYFQLIFYSVKIRKIGPMPTPLFFFLFNPSQANVAPTALQLIKYKCHLKKILSLQYCVPSPHDLYIMPWQYCLPM